MTAIQIYGHPTMQPLVVVHLPDDVIATLHTGGRVRIVLYPDPTPYSLDPGAPGPIMETMKIVSLWAERAHERGEKFLMICTDLKAADVSKLERLFPLPNPSSQRPAGS